MDVTIQNLLDKAAAIEASADDKMSSVASARRKFSTAAEAEKHFSEFGRKLFRINDWNAHSGLTSFELFDETGKPRGAETAKTGNFVRLSLAGSGKSDWVKIVKIGDEPDETILTVQPTYNPTEENPDKSVTSHFFTCESTNNFCLQKKDDTINFYVIGLDEISNTRNTNNIIETARNVAAANVGRYLGIQKGEWTTFCENFLEIEKDT